MEPDAEPGSEVETRDDEGYELEPDPDAVGIGDAEGVEAEGFDIDDKGRTETVLKLGDGTRLHVIQQIFVDWVAPRSVKVVLKGFANRRNPDGSLPSNARYNLTLGHGILFTLKKISNVSFPVDFSPLSDGTWGFNPAGSSTTFAAFDSELFTARSNSIYHHYWGTRLVDATGEPSDNSIKNLRTEALTVYDGPYRCKSYAARRGGA